jgi:hypothetical protein
MCILKLAVGEAGTIILILTKLKSLATWKGKQQNFTSCLLQAQLEEKYKLFIHNLILMRLNVKWEFKMFKSDLPGIKSSNGMLHDWHGG